MIVKWKTGGIREPIYRVEFLRETKHFHVLQERDSRGVLRERRESKNSGYETFHDSWEEAKNYLVEKTRDEILATKDRLERLENKLSRYSALENPEKG